MTVAQLEGALDASGQQRMNLDQLARVLRRRWWVVAPVLLLTLVAGWFAVARANSTFQATATLLLASPDLSAADRGAEEVPVLRPSIVAEIVRSDDTRVSLGTGATDYSVTVTPEGILQVEATSETATGVVDTADAVIDEIVRVVEDMNEEDPGPDATLNVLARPSLARERTVLTASDDTKIEFFASGSVLMNVGEEAANGGAFNPYTPSEGTLRVLAEVVSPERVRNSITQEVDDENAEFELVFDIRDVAPVLNVVATATSSDATMDTLDAAVAFLEADLAERQTLAGADESSFLWYQRLAYPEVAEVASGGLQRTLATILVLGCIAAISLAVVVDAIIERRKRGASGKHAIVEREDLVEAEPVESKLDSAASREAS
jgi:hypothetical protein